MGYTENINSILKWGNSFQRQFDFPLDRSSLHSSYEDAVAYAKGDGSDERELGKQAYIGQTITVWGLNEKGKEGVWVYSLVPSAEGSGYLADLKPVGSTTTETADTYSAAVTLSEGLVVGQLILVATEETVEEQTYKAGFYIVNAPGSISALDTSTGASDEIGALTNRVAAIEGNRVLNTTFETYQGQVTTALEGKVSNDDFATYQGEVTTALGNVNTAIDSKVSNDDFGTYQGQVTTALGEKVNATDFETYQGQVTTALGEKATATDLNNLETKVDGDIQVLTELIDDYSGTLGDVDDRLGELEAFVEAHSSIEISEIEELFSQSNE